MGFCAVHAAHLCCLNPVGQECKETAKMGLTWMFLQPSSLLGKADDGASDSLMLTSAGCTQGTPGRQGNDREGIKVDFPGAQ